MNIQVHLRGEDNIPRAFLELLETVATIYQGQSVKLKPRDAVMNLFSCLCGDGKFYLTSLCVTDSALGRAALVPALACTFQQLRTLSVSCAALQFSRLAPVTVAFVFLTGTKLKWNI